MRIWFAAPCTKLLPVACGPEAICNGGTARSTSGRRSYWYPNACKICSPVRRAIATSGEGRLFGGGLHKVDEEHKLVQLDCSDCTDNASCGLHAGSREERVRLELGAPAASMIALEEGERACGAIARDVVSGRKQHAGLRVEPIEGEHHVVPEKIVDEALDGRLFIWPRRVPTCNTGG